MKTALILGVTGQDGAYLAQGPLRPVLVQCRTWTMIFVHLLAWAALGRHNDLGCFKLE